MRITVEQSINADRARIWQSLTNVGESPRVMPSIQKVEVLEKPARGLVGLKWRETRAFLGKEATEVMWVTAAQEGQHYDVRAESHGAIYTTRVALSAEGPPFTVSMDFVAQPVTIGARIMWFLTGWMFARATRKALAQDLLDMKTAIED